MNAQSNPAPIRRQDGMTITRQQWTLAIAALVILAAGYWYISTYLLNPPQAAPAPPTSKQAVPELAREVINEQQQSEQPDYPAALEQARSLKAEGKLADAQLLYFFAARGGHAPAAFELAELYDPLYHEATSNLMEEPDAFQAFKWYQQALEGGEAAATERLENLKAWAEEAAEEGNLDAEQLLLQWN